MPHSYHNEEFYQQEVDRFLRSWAQEPASEEAEQAAIADMRAKEISTRDAAESISLTRGPIPPPAPGQTPAEIKRDRMRAELGPVLANDVDPSHQAAMRAYLAACDEADASRDLRDALQNPSPPPPTAAQQQAATAAIDGLYDRFNEAGQAMAQKIARRDPDALRWFTDATSVAHGYAAETPPSAAARVALDEFERAHGTVLANHEHADHRTRTAEWNALHDAVVEQEG